MNQLRGDQMNGNRKFHFLIWVAIFASASAAAPARAQFQNPIQAAKDAYTKAKQQQKQQQQGQPQSQTATPAAAAQPASAPAQPAPSGSGAAGSSAGAPGSAAPWSPDSESGPATANPPARIDPAKMPDIVGIRIGMTLREASDAIVKQYPGARVNPYAPERTPTGGTVLISLNLNRGIASPVTTDQIAVDATMLPNPAIVWHVSRAVINQHVSRQTVLAALRAKYGKETFDIPPGGTFSSKPVPEGYIGAMMWTFDEEGGHTSPPDTIFASGCVIESGIDNARRWRDWSPTGNSGANTHGYCASSLVTVVATLTGSPDIINDVAVEMSDVPFILRSSKATANWWNAEVAKQHQADLQKASQAKPTL
jgi:hypothetical protein